MTTLVPVSPNQRLVLKDASIDEVAQALLGAIPLEDAPSDFPDLPAPLTASKEIRDALKVLTQTFNSVIVKERRTMTDAERASIGKEFDAIQAVLKLLGKREEQIKEIVRTHQDVDAEEKGLAFPKDVKHNGNVVAKATERDPKGHYLLATPGNPQETEIPGSTLKFSNQFTRGRVTKDLDWVTRAYEAGEIDQETYLGCTVLRRVASEDKIRKHVLKTGKVWILERVVKRGRPFSSMYLRPLTKKS